MPNSVHCDIVSIKESIYSGSIQMLIAHGKAGDLGILPGHAPLLTELDPGPVRVIREGGEEELFYVSGGVLEVQPHVITVLADTAIRAADIDEAAALEARRAAQDALSNQKSDMDTGAAMAALAEVAGQLRTLQKMKNRA